MTYIRVEAQLPDQRGSKPNLCVGKDFEETLERSRELAWSIFGKRIRFYIPSFAHYENPYFRSSATAFPSISITGTSCALRCKHCGGRVLETMIPATTPKRLFEVCESLKKRGCGGCLISGGCLPDGSIPLERFLEVFAKIKRESGLTLAVHTGIIGEDTARRLKESGVDVALIDVIGSEDTIREICQLDVKVEDYEESLRALNDSGIPYVPHVIVGLHYGVLKGERRSLEMISRHRPEAVVVIALIPLRGTEMEKIPPPSPEDIAKVLVEARMLLPETPIVLGCMRPIGRHRVETDTLAVKAGANAIAFPEREAIELAKSMGLKIEFSEKCCSQIYEDVGRL